MNATNGPFEFRCQGCPWRSRGNDWRRLYRRAIKHCESCGGPVEEVRANG